jgi:hypothetical protein
MLKINKKQKTIQICQHLLAMCSFAKGLTTKIDSA